MRWRNLQARKMDGGSELEAKLLRVFAEARGLPPLHFHVNNEACFAPLAAIQQENIMMHVPGGKM